MKPSALQAVMRNVGVTPTEAALAQLRRRELLTGDMVARRRLVDQMRVDAEGRAAADERKRKYHG